MNHLAPASFLFSAVMTKLLNEGSHILSATMLMNSNGQMRRAAAEIYWRLLMGHEISEFEVQQLLYLPKQAFEAYYSPNGLPANQVDLFGSDTEPEEPVSNEAEDTAEDSGAASAEVELSEGGQ